MLQRLVIALNMVNSNVWAIWMLGNGSALYLAARHFGLDYSVPAGIVGAAINMLTHTSTQSSAVTQPDGKQSTTQQTQNPQSFTEEPKL